MRQLLVLLPIIFMFSPFSLSAVELGGITMPEKLQAGESSLVLNGAGIRSKFIFDLYVAGLYLTNKSTDAKAIIQSDDAMAIRLHIISSKVTSKRMVNGMRAGFKKSTGGHSELLTEEMDLFLSTFNDHIDENDVFEFVYSSNKGLIVSKNDIQHIIIPSLAFKQALFGIWLSDKPATAKLKKRLLGNN